MIFACSGVAIECNNRATRFMTAGSLIRVLNNKVKDHDNLKVGAADHHLYILHVY